MRVAHVHYANDVWIGSNVIVGAGSLVTRDLEPNSVYAGAPARRIKSLDEYMQGLAQAGTYPRELAPKGNEVSPALADFLWNRFDEDRAQRPTENAQS